MHILIKNGRIVLLFALLVGGSFSCAGQGADRGETFEAGKKAFFDGNYEEALNIWSAYHGSYPYNFLLDKWKARSLMMLDRADEAYRLIEPYLEIIPEHPELLMLAGQCQLHLGFPEKSLALLESAARTLAGGAGIYLTQADLFLRFGLESRAIHAKNKASLLLDLDSAASATHEDRSVSANLEQNE